MAEPRVINPWQLFTGALIPNWLAEREELTPGAKLTYARLSQYAGRAGVAYPTQAELAASLGVTERQVRRYLHELQGFPVSGIPAFPPLILVRRVGLRRANRITFAAHPWIPGSVPEGQLEGAAESVPDRTRVALQERTSTSALERTSTSAPIGRESEEENQRTARPVGSRPVKPASPARRRPAAPAPPTPDVGGLVAGLARSLSRGHETPPLKRGGPRERAEARLARMGRTERAELQRFAGWLLGRGYSAEQVQAVVADYLARPTVANPFAYYRDDSAALRRVLAAVS